jgi:shikimate dehydrogenase
MTAPDTPRFAALIGWPLTHSRSALIHRTWAEREGVNAYYAPVAVEPGYDAFARAADALAALGFRGANITIPHKENAFRYAAERSAAAMAAGAANMLTFRPEGALADNSDIAGFKASLEGALAGTARGKAVVLGAGGAARAVLVALKDLGYREILIANRSPMRAKELADGFGAKPVAWANREAPLADADLLVNATNLGGAGSPPLEIRLDALPAGAVVSDIVANPPVTALLIAARARGHRTADGITMLMRQAVPAYKAWLGRKAVVDADLRQRLEAALTPGRTL